MPTTRNQEVLSASSELFTQNKKAKTDDLKKTKQALLFQALGGIYLESSPDKGIVMSLSHPKDEDLQWYFKDYVLTSEQLSVQSKVIPSVATVQSNTLLSHMLDRGHNASFEQEVALAKSASETLKQLSQQIQERALDYADACGISNKIKAMFNEAKAKLVMEHPVQPFVPILPFWATSLDKDMPSDEARYAFEMEVMYIFSFMLTRSSNFPLQPTDVAIIPNGSCKPFLDMSEEEEERAGAIVLDMIRAMLVMDKPDSTESAIVDSLKAAHGLAIIAQRLECACRPFIAL